MFHLADLASSKSWSVAPHVYIAVQNCLSQKQSTISLLAALDQVPAPVVSRICLELSGWHSSNDPPMSIAKLQNLIEAIGVLCVADGPIPIPVTMSLIFKITCLAVHLVKLPNALQNAELWGAVFGSLSRLIRRSMMTMSSHASTPPENSPEQILTAEGLRAFISSCDLSTLAILSETCLKGVQKEDSKIHDEGHSAPPQTYTEWLAIASSEDTVFSDEFVEILGVIYVASHASDPLDSEGTRFWRLRRLGLTHYLQHAVPSP
ncbi:hypothetical protein BC629DRAFT_316763 [Irpex lacteus]|nr:hypothetical protein BC629DRAFT_316763 [Irpex lacteus]